MSRLPLHTGTLAEHEQHGARALRVLLVMAVRRAVGRGYLAALVHARHISRHVLHICLPWILEATIAVM